MTFEFSSVLCTLGFVFAVFTPEEWNVYRSRNVISGTPLGVRCLDLRVFDSSSNALSTLFYEPSSEQHCTPKGGPTLFTFRDL